MNHYLIGLVASVVCLVACAQATDKPLAPSRAPISTPTTAQTRPVRVIVQFNQPVAYHSAELLQRLQLQTQAQVGYVAPVFSDTHVYVFQLAGAQALPQLLHQIRALPEVAGVEIDQKMLPH